MAENEKMREIGRKKKIVRVSVVDQVCDAIKKGIASGVWKAGDKLPSEQEFADEFGVNRLSVRMALQKLSTLGIIETRTGEGSFISNFSLKPVLSELAVFYEDESLFHDTQQLRRLLETECLQLAVTMATDQEKAQLKKALDEYTRCEEAYYNDLENKDALEALVNADFNFHYQVVQISHNQLYKDIYYMIQQLIRNHITKLQSTRQHRRRAAGLTSPLIEDDSHNKIYNCIISGDAEGLQKISDEMLALAPIPGVDTFDNEDKAVPGPDGGSAGV